MSNGIGVILGGIHNNALGSLHPNGNGLGVAGGILIVNGVSVNTSQLLLKYFTETEIATIFGFPNLHSFQQSPLRSKIIQGVKIASEMVESKIVSKIKM